MSIKAVAELRALAEEIRRSATRRGTKPLLPPPPETPLRWAARLEDIAAQAEREEGRA